MIKEGLCFDDVLLEPQYSSVNSRASVDLSVKIREFNFQHPFIPANMKTISGYNMALAIYHGGGLALVHRFMSLEDQLSVFNNLKFLYEHNEETNNLWVRNPFDHIGFSVGVKKEDKLAVDAFVKAGVKILCIDIAHAHSENGIFMTKWIKDKYPDVLLISGNVATGNGARALWKSGADIVKVNIGAGSLCSTRIMTGCGVPQLSALIDVSETKKMLECEIGRKLYVISDGGATVPGDFVKALTLSDMVMSGYFFAGCDETPGLTKEIDGVMHKEYVGSSTHKTSHVEGVESWVPSKGKFSDILRGLCRHVRSGCSYQGVNSLTQLGKQTPTFIKISSSGLKESHPHNVIIKENVK